MLCREFVVGKYGPEGYKPLLDAVQPLELRGRQFVSWGQFCCLLGQSLLCFAVMQWENAKPAALRQSVRVQLSPSLFVRLGRWFRNL